jgi:glycerol-3-phosphate dehydrogenase
MKVSAILAILIIVLGGASVTFAMTADEIMKKVDERDTGKTQISTATMKLINKKGN